MTIGIGFQRAFSAIFQRSSLKTRVTLFTLAFFLVGIWSLAFYASRMLRDDMQRMLSEQQFSTVSAVAAHINNEMEDRLQALENIAGKITPAILGKRAAIVNDLLTLARRGVSGKVVLNLNEIIADCRQSPEFEKLSSDHPAVQIRFDLEPALPNITCSSVHLGKSLYNLLSNACEAMPNGGIATIRTSRQYLDRPLQGYDEI